MILNTLSSVHLLPPTPPKEKKDTLCLLSLSGGIGLSVEAGVAPVPSEKARRGARASCVAWTSLDLCCGEAELAQGLFHCVLGIATKEVVPFANLRQVKAQGPDILVAVDGTVAKIQRKHSLSEPVRVQAIPYIRERRNPEIAEHIPGPAARFHHRCPTH
jgi:hypothetical protein